MYVCNELKFMKIFMRRVICIFQGDGKGISMLAVFGQSPAGPPSRRAVICKKFQEKLCRTLFSFRFRHDFHHAVTDRGSVQDIKI